jgi:hypothetical protein
LCARPSTGHARLLTIRRASDEIGLPEDSIRPLIVAGDLNAVRPPNINRVYMDRCVISARSRRFFRRSRVSAALSVATVAAGVGT